VREGRRDRARIVANVTLVVLVLAAGAGAAIAPSIPAGLYTGSAGGHGRISLLVARDGHRITRYSASGRLRCNRPPFRGGRYHWRISPERRGREPIIRIRAGGRFAIVVHTHQPLRAPSGTVATVRGSYALRGAFVEARAASRRQPAATGTLHAVLTGPGGLRCDGGRHRWSARRAR